MTNDLLKLSLITVAFCIALMTIFWLVSRRIRNVGIIDIAWSFAFTPLVIIYAALGNGDVTRRCVIAAMAVFWSMRLGLHVAIRVVRLHPQEDGRYVELRKEWAKNWERTMFWFFEFQAILIMVLALPLLLICLNARQGLSVIEIIGAALWCVAVGGESVADHQLKVFKANPANHGKVCQAGLWHYSRHPNYFFEWLVWIAYFVFALGSPWGWVTAYCPALMLFFLIKVTGIPMTEQLSVKNRGELYREYQRTTSMFVPWFRKSGANPSKST
jgi:steroid 5-alpha reductase family enzyme